MRKITMGDGMVKPVYNIHGIKRQNEIWAAEDSPTFPKKNMAERTVNLPNWENPGVLGRTVSLMTIFPRV
ncbi:MAG: hypothetical protein HY882_04515 [Deltaproteobacteria bacterium]|nr:hypothetical protein [Deltaproteobacteria bacterium]